MCGVAVAEPGAADQARLHRVVGGEVAQVDQRRPLHVRHAALPERAHAALAHDLTERVSGVLHPEHGRKVLQNRRRSEQMR